MTTRDLFENPVLGSRAQRIQSLFAACFAINAHNRFCPGQPVADPGSITEYQLQSVLANDLANLVPAKLARIRLQLFSELRLHLRRQSEVLALGKKQPTWLLIPFNWSRKDFPLFATASQHSSPARMPSFSGT